MYNNNIGIIIKQLRKKKGITQEELSSDLCSLSQLYRIEKGVHFPSAFLLQEFSNRLCENIVKYIDFSNCDYPIYLFDFFDKLEHLRLKRKYKTIISHIDDILSIPKYYKDIRLPNVKQLLDWYAGISISIIEKRTLSIDYYLNLLKLTNNNCDYNSLFDKNLTLIEIKITHSIAITYFTLGKYSTAKKILLSLIDNIKSFDVTISLPVLAEIYYSVSRLLYIKKDYNESLKYSKKGISLCIYNYFSYTLADLFYISGQSYECMHDIENAVENYNKFLNLYDIIGHDSFSLNCKNYLTKKYSSYLTMLKNFT